MDNQIIAALSTPLAYPQLEALIYPDGRPNDWAGQFDLGLAPCRLVRTRKIYARKATSKNVNDFGGMLKTWGVYCTRPIPKNFVAPSWRELRLN